jgi:rare lipoprotein A
MMGSPARLARRVFLLTCAAPLAAAAIVMPALVEASQPATPRRRRRAPRRRILARQVGDATFYGRAFDGERTASGTRYDQNGLTAAHRTWPFGTVVRVTELERKRSVVVTITDRGPFGRNRREGAVIDLSRAAARRLRMIQDGQVRVRLEVLRWGEPAAAKRSAR